MEGCGYCKQCIRLRTLRAVGRKPEHNIECAYKHILDSYRDFGTLDHRDRTSATAANSTSTSASSLESCGSNCRWVSWSGSSETRSDYEDHGSFDPNVRISRKRVKFHKKKPK